MGTKTYKPTADETAEALYALGGGRLTPGQRLYVMDDGRYQPGTPPPWRTP